MANARREAAGAVLDALVAPTPRPTHWHVAFFFRERMPRYTEPIRTRPEANEAAVRWKRALARRFGIRWSGDVREALFTPLPSSQGAPPVRAVAILPCDALACPHRDVPGQPPMA